MTGSAPAPPTPSLQARSNAWRWRLPYQRQGRTCGCSGPWRRSRARSPETALCAGDRAGDAPASCSCHRLRASSKHLGHAVEARRREGLDTPDHLLAHISPLGWAHILLTGEYLWPKGTDA
ncbi:MAG: Tn3 family transposase [Rhizorhabdus sp.]|uniref:Tn3 family transposase n=1 Tax=Rhizorhabdus sp. TaxID=1968843 RepID=UPI001B6283DF|nr:Tn3 family transposase [Rhizorhabdus sp.]